MVAGLSATDDGAVVDAVEVADEAFAPDQFALSRAFKSWNRSGVFLALSSSSGKSQVRLMPAAGAAIASAASAAPFTALVLRPMVASSGWC
jgi:hypothetical protein